MAKVKASNDIQQVAKEEVPRYVDLALKDIMHQINGNLDFASNFNCQVITVNFAIGLVQQAINHTLSRVATNYLIISKSRACDVYTGTTPAANNVLYLTCNLCPATVTLVVF